MGKLAEDVALASAELSPVWDGERSARLLSGIRGKQRRRVRNQRIASVLAVAVVIGATAFTMRDRESAVVASKPPTAQDGALADAPVADAQPVSGTIREGHTIRLLDGSSAQLAGAQSELAIVRNDRERVGLKLLQGRAHFDVVPNSKRSFEVEAAPYRVVVLGTIFDVERSAEHVSVTVERGRVRVYGPQGAEDLLAGTSKRFEMVAAGAEVAPVEPAVLEPIAIEAEEPVTATRESRRRTGNRPAGHASSSWRSLTQSGDYDAAFESLKMAPVVQNDPAELMLAADAARLSGHPAEAVSYLRRVVEGHRKSPVAPLAAFTLGREYLDRLGQPHKAAEAFEIARKLDPAGSMAQDALAREVEALSKGGNAEKAYERARQYMQAYPNGRRLRAVQLYGGIN
jgi:transmembrane sensor